MHAFGDALLFLFVFGGASIVPTVLALLFLQRYRGLWMVLCVVAVGIAATGLGAVAAVAGEGVNPGTGIWAMLAVPRILLAPLAVGLFGVCAWFAPGPAYRRWLLVAVGGECIASLYGLFHWFAPLLFK